ALAVVPRLRPRARRDRQHEDDRGRAQNGGQDRHAAGGHVTRDLPAKHLDQEPGAEEGAQDRAHQTIRQPTRRHPLRDETTNRRDQDQHDEVLKGHSNASNRVTAGPHSSCSRQRSFMMLWRLRDLLVIGEALALSFAIVPSGLHRSGLALLVLLLVGCGQTPATTGTTPSVGASKVATPSPTPLFGFPDASGVTCPDLASLGLERALLNAADQAHPDRRDVILCDIHDTAHPRTLQALLGSTSQSFLGQNLIGYIALKGGGPSSTPDQFTSVLTTLNLTTGQTAELASNQGIALAGGWSGDGSSAAYFTDTGGVHHYWLKRGSAAPVEFSTPAQVLGRGGTQDDESLVAFSPDGKYVLVVDTAVNRLQAFRTSDAVQVYAAPSGGAGGFRSMAVWTHTGDRFYFRNNSGVYQWDA